MAVHLVINVAIFMFQRTRVLMLTIQTYPASSHPITYITHTIHANLTFLGVPTVTLYINTTSAASITILLLLYSH